MTRRSSASVLFASAMVLCAGACKAQKVDDEAAKTKAEAKHAEAAPEERGPDGPPGSGLARVFSGTKPQLPASIAKLRAGQRSAEVRELAPGLSDTEQPKIKQLEDPRLPDVVWALRFDETSDEGRLLSVTAELDRQAALEHAKRSWGEPRTVTDGNGYTSFYWFDEQAQLRASLRPVNAEGVIVLEFMPYLSAAELLGQGSTGLGSGALLGLSRAEIETKHAEQLRRVVDRPGSWTAQLWYPASTWNPQPTLVLLEADDAGESVEQVVLELPFLHLPKLRAELFAELVEQFGEPVSGDAELGGRFETEAVAIEVRTERGRWVLTATKKAGR